MSSSSTKPQPSPLNGYILLRRSDRFYRLDVNSIREIIESPILDVNNTEHNDRTLTFLHRGTTIPLVEPTIAPRSCKEASQRPSRVIVAVESQTSTLLGIVADQVSTTIVTLRKMEAATETSIASSTEINLHDLLSRLPFSVTGAPLTL